MSSIQTLLSGSRSTTLLTSNRPPIIGLSGKMGAGKTYLASYMLQNYGFPVVSFADQLKRDLVHMGIDPDEVYHKKTPIIRKLMQVYGQAHRYQDPDYWLKRGMYRAQELQGPHPVVFDDVRFFNEAEAIRQDGGIVVRLVNTGTKWTGDDPSETDLDDYEDFDHYIVVGNGELEELTSAMDDILVYEGWAND